jgi:hypothetical protein
MSVDGFVRKTWGTIQITFASHVTKKVIRENGDVPLHIKTRHCHITNSYIRIGTIYGTPIFFNCMGNNYVMLYINKCYGVPKILILKNWHLSLEFQRIKWLIT